jgi:hypothetical protein
MNLSCSIHSCSIHRRSIAVDRAVSTEVGQGLNQRTDSIECPNCGQVPLTGGSDATLSFVQPKPGHEKKIAHFTLIRMLGFGTFNAV